MYVRNTPEHELFTIDWFTPEDRHRTWVFTLPDGSLLCFVIYGGALEYRSPAAVEPPTPANPVVQAEIHDAPGWWAVINATPVTTEEAARSERARTIHEQARMGIEEGTITALQADDEAHARVQLAAAGVSNALEVATGAVIAVMQDSGKQTYEQWLKAHYPQQT